MILHLAGVFKFMEQTNLYNSDFLDECDRVNKESCKDEKNASHHPSWNGGESFNVWRVVGDGVEDVDQDQEEGHEDRHPARNHIRWNEETRLQTINN